MPANSPRHSPAAIIQAIGENASKAALVAAHTPAAGTFHAFVNYCGGGTVGFSDILAPVLETDYKLNLYR
jgi:hypothetical protein